MKKFYILVFLIMCVYGISHAQVYPGSLVSTIRWHETDGLTPGSSIFVPVTESNTETDLFQPWALPPDGSTSTQSRIPRNATMKYQRTQYLITAQEILASGFPPGEFIDAIGYSIATSGSGTQTGTFNLYLKNTSDETYTLGSTWNVEGFIQVINNGSFTVPYTAGTYTLPFSTPFTYTGNGVYIAWEFSNPGASSGIASLAANCNTSRTDLCYGYQSATTQGTSLTVSSYRPATFFVNNAIVDVASITNIYTLERAPLPFASPVPVAVRVVNSSGSAASFDVILTIKDASSSYTRYTQTQTITNLAAGTATILNYSWLPEIQEDILITATTSEIEGETWTANNSLTEAANVNNTCFSYCYAFTGASTYGFTYPAYGLCVSKFTMNGSQNILGTNLFIGSDAASIGKTIYAVVLNSAGVILDQSDNHIIEVSDLGTNRYFVFPNTPLLSNTTFYAGLAQTQGTGQYYPLGIFYEYPRRTGVFYTQAAGGGTLTELSSSVNYKFGIEAVVGPLASVNPSGFTATPVSSSQINLQWTANSANDNVLLAWSSNGQFGTPVNGTLYNPGEQLTGGGTILQYSDLTTFSHEGLAENTLYHYRIWSYNGTNYSTGVTTVATTLCGIYPSPWQEDFEPQAFPPACWSTAAIITWQHATDCSSYGIGSSSARAPFYTQYYPTPFDLLSYSFNSGNLTSPVLQFDYAYATADNEVDQLLIYTSTDDGLSYTLLATMNGGLNGILNTGGATLRAFIPASSQWATAMFSLPAGTNRIKFTGISAYGNYLYLDKIRVMEAPTCIVPSNGNAQSTTTNSATLTWTENGEATIWDIEIVNGGTPASGNPTYSNITSKPFVAANLNAGQNYDFYIRAKCGGTLGNSSWAGPFSFITCGDFPAPFAETVEPGEYNACWSMSETSNIWAVSSLASGYGAGVRSFKADFINTASGSQFLYSPEINTAALSQPQLKFDYAYATTTNEVDYLNIYSSVNSGVSYNLLVTMPGGADGILNTGGASFQSFVPEANQWSYLCLDLPQGTNRVAFEAVSGNGNNLFIDNIKIREARYDVTFTVDMSTAEGFIPGTDTVYLTGTFTGWAEPGSPGSLQMIREGSSLLYTKTVELLPGNYEYKYFVNSTWSGGEWDGEPNRSYSISGTTSINDTWGGSIEWANLQWPANGTIASGSEFNVYAQVYIPNNKTALPGPAFGLQSWIGFSSENTNPATWTNWVPANFNTQVSNSDEFVSNLGTTLNEPGTYYYASRFRFGSSGEFIYGGYNGGYWNGVSNVSGTITVTDVSKTLTLELLLEGLYSGNGFMTEAKDESGAKWGQGIADKISIELHNSSNYDETILTFNDVLLSTQGIAIIENIPGTLNGSYFITVKHRNSMETTTAAPVSFVGSTLSVDFKNTASQVHGGNVRNFGTVYAIYSGDINQDGVINQDDISVLFTGSSAFERGYVSSDVNGDGIVDAADMILVDNNAAAYIQKSTP